MSGRRVNVEQPLFGAYIGTVVKVIEDSKDERVFVKFGWFDDSTEFEARVASTYSGSNYGSLWTPEKETEVVVVFDHGDMRAPIILGSLYNGKDMPPSRRRDGSDRKMWRTAAGHQLVFEDGPKEQWVELKSNAGHRVFIDDTKGRMELSFANGASIVLTQSELKLSAATISIEGSASVKVNAETIHLN